MKGAIIAIGDELCIGDIVNNNAAYLARKCTELGILIDTHVTVGDNLEQIVTELQRLAIDHELILTTGGLGPTHDDRTKDAIAQFFNVSLQHNEQAAQWVRQYLAQQQREYTDRQATQSILPACCEPLYNAYGTAPGLWCEKSGFPVVVALPGVPAEMRFIVEDSVLPRLQQRVSHQPRMLLRTYGIIGIPEAELFEQLSEDVRRWESEGITVAFLPSAKLVRLRFRWIAPPSEPVQERVVQIESVLQQRFGRRVIPYDAPLEATIGTLLAERGETLAVAESCTGGYLGKRITDIPGSSRYFLGGIIVYSNEAKKRFLNVPQEILDTVGAVSREVAELLAANVRTAFSSTYGIGITGIAGPGGGTPQKPVGTVWIGIATPSVVTPHLFHFKGDRETIRRAATTHALLLLLEHLTATTSAA